MWFQEVSLRITTECILPESSCMLPKSGSCVPEFVNQLVFGFRIKGLHLKPALSPKPVLDGESGGGLSI